MVRVGRHTIADYLTLITGYSNEHMSGVLQEATSRLGFIHSYLTTGATEPAFERFARALLRPLFDDVGVTASASDSDERRTLRSTVIAALGDVGSDADVVSKSRTALDRALAGGPALDPTTATAIVRTAATHGDAALFDALAAAADRATSPEDQYRYLYALADFRDPVLIDRGLQRVLSPQIRTQDAAIYLGRFLGNPAARARAWTFITQHWAELAPKVSIFGGDTNLVRAVSAFCDATSRDRIVAFFAAHPLPAAARTLDQTLEQINSCIAMREAHTSGVAAWLSNR
jgi:aminopeptidase N